MSLKPVFVFVLLVVSCTCVVVSTSSRAGVAMKDASTCSGASLYILEADTDSNPQADNAQGTVTFKADSAIINLEKGKRGFKDVKGYRIQIFVGTADQMKTERNKFLALGLNYSVYPKQIVPEYALQVGDFPTRMEMEKHLERIKKHYPKAFPVVEVIEVPKFGK